MSDLTGGMNGGLMLAAVQDLVRATYAEVEAIKANAPPAGPVASDATSIEGIPAAPDAWIPELRFGGASVGITYGAQLGSVIRIGKLTVAHFTIILTSKGISVGTATLAGLPVACGARDGAVVISSHAVMATANVFECAVSGGSTIIALGKGNAAASGVLDDTDFTNTTAISGTATYIAG